MLLAFSCPVYCTAFTPEATCSCNCYNSQLDLHSLEKFKREARVQGFVLIGNLRRQLAKLDIVVLFSLCMGSGSTTKHSGRKTGHGRMACDNLIPGYVLSEY